MRKRKFQRSTLSNEDVTIPKPRNKAGTRGVKERKTERLVIDEERVIKADVPAEPRFKGYEGSTQRAPPPWRTRNGPMHKWIAAGRRRYTRRRDRHGRPSR